MAGKVAIVEGPGMFDFWAAVPRQETLRFKGSFGQVTCRVYGVELLNEEGLWSFSCSCDNYGLWKEPLLKGVYSPRKRTGHFLFEAVGQELIDGALRGERKASEIIESILALERLRSDNPPWDYDHACFHSVLCWLKGKGRANTEWSYTYSEIGSSREEIEALRRRASKRNCATLLDNLRHKTPPPAGMSWEVQTLRCEMQKFNFLPADVNSTEDELRAFEERWPRAA